MRKIGTAVLVLVLSAPAAQALSRYEATSLSCSRIQALLQSEGPAILRYPSPRNPGLTLYDTYVAEGRSCRTSGRGRLATVPAADTKSCKVIRCIKRHGGGR